MPSEHRGRSPARRKNNLPQRLAGNVAVTAGRRQSQLDIAVDEIGRNMTGVQNDVSKLADFEQL